MILAALVVIEVAQDCEDPSLEIGARRELLGCRQSTDCRVVHEIVRSIAIARQRPGEGAQMRNAIYERRAEFRRCFFDYRLAHSRRRSPLAPSAGTSRAGSSFGGGLSPEFVDQ